MRCYFEGGTYGVVAKVQELGAGAIYAYDWFERRVTIQGSVALDGEPVMLSVRTL